MLSILDQLDTSAYPEDHVLYSKVNKKVLGKFKDETNSLPMRAIEIGGVKNYSFIYGDNVEVKHLKGVNKGTRHGGVSFFFFFFLASLLPVRQGSGARVRPP